MTASTYLTNSYDAISSLFLLISLESLKIILILSVWITETSKFFHEDSYVMLYVLNPSPRKNISKRSSVVK